MSFYQLDQPVVVGPDQIQTIDFKYLWIIQTKHFFPAMQTKFKSLINIDIRHLISTDSRDTLH